MVVQRGELYFLKDGGTAATKGRPILVVSRDELCHGHSVLVVPFYSQQLEVRRKQRNCVFFHAGEGGLAKNCVAKCDEVTIVDKDCFDFARGKLGRLNLDQMKRVVDAIRFVIRDDSL